MSDQNVIIETTPRQARLNERFAQVLQQYRDSAADLNIIILVSGDETEVQDARNRFEAAQIALDEIEDRLWESENRERHEPDLD